MGRTILLAVCAALLLTVFAAAPALASMQIAQYEEHGAWAMWNWGGEYPFEDGEDPAEWLIVAAWDYKSAAPGQPPSGYQLVELMYQSGVFDGQQWSGEAMIGYTLAPTTLTRQGYRILSFSGTVNMYECTDFDCYGVGASLGTAEVSVTMSKAPGQSPNVGGPPPSNGLHFDDWWGTGCTVDQVSGMLMYTNATATATWTWEGVTRTFPEAGVEYHWAYGFFEMAKGTELVVCPDE